MTTRSLFVLLFFCSILSAQKVYFPQADSTLEITFPETWNAVHYEHFLEARSMEDSLQFILMRFGPGHNIESAKSFLLSFLKEMASDLQMQKGETITTDEISFFCFKGEGKISEQSKFIVTSYIFYLNENDYYSIIAIYSHPNFERTDSEIKRVLNTIRKM